ncbi:TIGR03668 family PPOX class F420-dependent oxidoreductase [Natrinema halophilum]|uniref:TIGR03668 family PPOX class F420-dependent oxidoreductase n=1 Tax=Natrinema halophilum TaxID=1699371 RepID=A0A7D5KKU9_9EURY|nr:TIGR03668 family PPOX class F420-dependent oxidoreductase [Natrinema halophilum]QLG49378.1 TIGR03668 family PPOX class F420-dependent oxidoreductase [Natrinema halophilum]
MTPEEQAFLERTRVGALATVDDERNPHVVPICYALPEFDDSTAETDPAIVSAIDEKPKATRKLQRVRNIRTNSRVTLLVDRYREDWSRLAWVQIRGRARIIEPDAAVGVRSDSTNRNRTGSTPHDAATGALERKYDQYADHDLGDCPVILIRVERTVSWGALDRGDGNESEDRGRNESGDRGRNVDS